MKIDVGIWDENLGSSIIMCTFYLILRNFHAESHANLDSSMHSSVYSEMNWKSKTKTRQRKLLLNSIMQFINEFQSMGLT